MNEQDILKEARRIRAEKLQVRKKKVREKFSVVNSDPGQLPDQKFPIIYADPPWAYYFANSFGDRSPENHYPTMSHEELLALPVRDMADKDALLFMWTTNSHLAEGLEVLKAWGFEYLSNMVWVKDQLGLGCWVRNKHELLLIGKRGKPLTPDPDVRPPSVFQATRRQHSAKPPVVYEIIERMYPDYPKIELFARIQRRGWGSWGNQTSSSSDDTLAQFFPNP